MEQQPAPVKQQLVHQYLKCGEDSSFTIKPQGGPLSLDLTFFMHLKCVGRACGSSPISYYDNDQEIPPPWSATNISWGENRCFLDCGEAEPGSHGSNRRHRRPTKTFVSLRIGSGQQTSRLP